MMSLENALQGIREEREYQNQKWGSQFDHDNTPNDWITYITTYVAKANVYPFDRDKFDQAMLQVAALAVAAIEQPDLAPRHYDGAAERLK